MRSGCYFVDFDHFALFSVWVVLNLPGFAGTLVLGELVLGLGRDVVTKGHGDAVADEVGDAKGEDNADGEAGLGSEKKGTPATPVTTEKVVTKPSRPP